MKQNLSSNKRGQSLVEYALLLVLVALVVIPLVALFGGGVKNAFANLFSGEAAATQVAVTDIPSEIPTESLTERPFVPLTPITTIAQDFMGRIMDFYNKNGKWPKSGGDKQFTDIGLRPNDWDNPVEGINWNPNGSTIDLSIKKEDNVKLYVNDLNGDTFQVFDNWKIICVATSGMCYYHTVAPGNEVDVNSLVVVEEKKHKD